jgi:hypothetical protein
MLSRSIPLEPLFELSFSEDKEKLQDCLNFFSEMYFEGLSKKNPLALSFSDSRGPTGYLVLYSLNRLWLKGWSALNA